MIQVNVGDHISPEPGYVAWPNHRRSLVFWARERAKWIARNKPAADPYFRRLPGGRSLTQLLGDRSLWINYDSTAVEFGSMDVVGGKEIAISERACAIGKWTVLATLIHELAHADGVDPAASPQDAENALIHCGLGYQRERDTGADDPDTPFDPDIIGRLRVSRNTRYA
jgi:hypothetical protein